MTNAKTTAVSTALATGSAADAARDLVADLRNGLAGREPVLVLVFASTQQPLRELMPAISGEFAGAMVLGASTAGEFTESRVAKSAVSAIAVAGDFEVHAGIGRGLAAAPERAVAAAVEGLPREVEGLPHRTAILLLDPLAGVSEEVTLMAASALGGDAPIPLAGGAAGDDLAMTKTWVGCGAEAASDAVVVATIHSRERIGIGVQHGHVALSAPMSVTRAEGATVHEIDGRPAWDVWADKTRESAAKRGVDPGTLSADELGGYLLRYEAGLASGDSMKIRAPLSRGADGSLGFACGIPQGAVIRITESEPLRQVESARAAARRARAGLDTEPAGAIVFDCICRNLILGDTFDAAVRGISEELGGVPLAGFETYGEIAMDVGDMSGFHNTTTVVLALPR
jgi:methyl-accepting chemotaxis protein